MTYDVRRRDLLVRGAVVSAAAAIPTSITAATATRVQLSLNENAYGPSAKVGPAIARAVQGLERYVTQAEVAALTRQIAVKEKVAPEQVVLGEVLEPLGLYLARQRPVGGNIVYSAPGYTALVDSAAPLGGRGVPVPLDRRQANDLSALAQAIDGATLAMSLINPHNPSGTVSEAAAYHDFIRDAAKRTLVVVDEAYLEYDDLIGLGAVRHVRAGANVLVFRTLAKIYGLAGLAVGYAVAPPSQGARPPGAGIGTPHSLSRLSLVAASAALNDQAHVAAVRAAVASERARVTAALDQAGLEHTDSRASFVFFRAAAADTLRQLFAKRGIEIGKPFTPLEDWVRITIGRPAENDRVIETIRASAKA